MGLWKWLFGKRKKPAEAVEEWEETVTGRDGINMHDKEERERYFTDCMEQIADAEKEINLLSGEYGLVTSYLTDMEEIEALPEGEARELRSTAKRVVALDQECLSYLDNSRRMEDADYRRIQSQEEEIPEGIDKLKEAEKYQKLIRQDLSRLDGERHAYRFRRNELKGILVNLKGMATICLTALGACLLMLVILHFGFELDTFLGYFIAVAAAAVAVTVIYVKYSDASRELARVERAINKLIMLQNKVKIRYVNNINLLNYLCMKYHVNNSGKLQLLWEQYQEEKEQRRQFAEAEAKLEYNQHLLVELLMRYRVKDPGRWIHQAAAILDKKEMVEIRHGLIGRRQALRKQLDYNKEVGGSAKQEIKEIAAQYPQYAEEITRMVERYEREFSGAY